MDRKLYQVGDQRQKYQIDRKIRKKKKIKGQTVGKQTIAAAGWLMTNRQNSDSPSQSSNPGKKKL